MVGLLARSWAEREKGRRAGLGLVLSRGKKSLRAETEEGREWKEISFFFL